MMAKIEEFHLFFLCDLCASVVIFFVFITENAEDTEGGRWIRPNNFIRFCSGISVPLW